MVHSVAPLDNREVESLVSLGGTRFCTGFKRVFAFNLHM